MQRFYQNDNSLFRKFRNEILRISPYKHDGLRITATILSEIQTQNFVLEDVESKGYIRIDEVNGVAEITNGKIVCKVSKEGFLSFYNGKRLLLEELWEVPNNPVQFSMKRIEAREYKAVANGDYFKMTQRFCAYEGESFYGLGQRQCGYLDLKNTTFELSQRNSEINIPFVLSNRGYGLFWNNCGVGSVELAKNVSKWTCNQSTSIDYYITCGNVKEIIENFTSCVGRAPEMPYCGTGFWASKLRYRTQDELMTAAEKYCKMGIKPSMMVIDYFHWENNGDWSLDARFWPNPKEMVEKLHEMGIEVMISVWPTLAPTSKNYKVFKENNFMIATNRGSRIQLNLLGNLEFYDATNENAREFLFNIIKENYLKYGIKYYWLDAAEPEILPYDFDNIRYSLGSGERVTNIYPYYYAKGFYDGLKKEGMPYVMNLARSAYAGSQKFGTAVWSGDVMSSFESLKNQIYCGINMGISGIPWWTSDIGGFEGADNKNEKFRELLVRWFQFGAFCPIFRLHGSRDSDDARDGTDIGYDDLIDVWGENHRKAKVNIYRENEPWIYSNDEIAIFKKYVELREQLRPYIAEQMSVSSKTGVPVMRPLFMNYEDDLNAWNIHDEFMFGEDILVAPIYEYEQRERNVYLPMGVWIELESEKKYMGGQSYKVDAPIDSIPVFYRAESNMKNLFKKTKNGGRF